MNKLRNTDALIFEYFWHDFNIFNSALYDIPVLEMIVTVLFMSSIVSLAALSIELRTVDMDAKAPRLNIALRIIRNW